VAHFVEMAVKRDRNDDLHIHAPVCVRSARGLLGPAPPR
jgi:hypothetical protein